jgi:hypothetical protein
VNRGAIAPWALVALAACGTEQWAFEEGGGDGGNEAGADALAPPDGAGVPRDAGPPQDAAPPDAGDAAPSASAAIDPSGRYTIVFRQPAWTFCGNLGVAPTDVAQSAASDRLGAYHEVTFAYDDGSAKTGAIRAYDATPVVRFTVNYVAAATNGAAAFPTLTCYPGLPYHLAFGEASYAPYTFDALAHDSPWVFFDASAEAFLVSGASHFMNASLARTPAGAIASGVDPAIAALPAGFSYQTVLVATPGINAAFDTWGRALTAWSGKTRPTSDATPDLARLGYWTDSGSRYYYQFDTTLGYAGTLVALRDSFQQAGIPLGYMQLDSWWYPKGAAGMWNDMTDGQYVYTADKTLFPNDLAAFQAMLGLPLVAHARWIDINSPYRSQYQMSNNVSIDPAYWSATADYLAGAGVVTYEQDWLNANALPSTDNLVDQDAFLDRMASAMATKGIALQYDQPLPRHFLQSTRYDNAITARVTGNRFSSSYWAGFLYGSRLASAVGQWPWTDVFLSTEVDNLLLATLSGGMVGVGDAIGAASAADLLEAVRSDGVIVKPDAPIVPVDATVVNDARALGLPVIGATYTDFGGLRASYVFAFAGASSTPTFVPAALGHAGQVYVFDYFNGTGKVADASAPYDGALTGGRAYYVVVPVGPSGIALIGDAGKFVSLGKKRVASLTDNGTLSVALAFAAGEGPIRLRGYAPAQPTASATGGSVGPVVWDPTSKLFAVSVSQSGGAAAVTLR